MILNIDDDDDDKDDDDGDNRCVRVHMHCMFLSIL